MAKNKILVLTKYSRKGASSRLRTLQYLPYLENKGYIFEVSSLFDDNYLESLYNSKKNSVDILKLYIKRLYILRKVYNYDLLWIEKELFPYLPSVFEKLMNILGIRYIVDYDDAIFHNYDMSNNELIRTFLSKKIDSVMKNSSCVIAGNQYLRERAEFAKAKNIHIVPTVVDHNKYLNHFASTNDVLTVGWIGSPTTQKYVLEILPALVAANKETSFKLLLVGASKNIINEIKDLEVEIHPWSEDTEVDLIRKMDIGIMPLHDGPWEQGKCGYKLIQYMACGVTVIASPVGVNKEIIVQSNAGQLASSREEWIVALTKALRSDVLRNKTGFNGRQAVKSYYSIESQANRINNIIKRCI